eukprot:COSAG04_NODE_2483_length_4038_cov_1.761107_2_plen_82_part_00
MRVMPAVRPPGWSVGLRRASTQDSPLSSERACSLQHRDVRIVSMMLLFSSITGADSLGPYVVTEPPAVHVCPSARGKHRVR